MQSGRPQRMPAIANLENEDNTTRHRRRQWLAIADELCSDPQRQPAIVCSASNKVYRIGQTPNAAQTTTKHKADKHKRSATGRLLPVSGGLLIATFMLHTPSNEPEVISGHCSGLGTVTIEVPNEPLALQPLGDTKYDYRGRPVAYRHHTSTQ